MRMWRSEPPFRADHVGSLLRPPELVRARAELAGAELRAVEDGAIAAAVAMQEEIGLQAATDGELRRQSWQGDFIRRLQGITMGAGEPSIPREFHTADGGTVVPTLGSVHVTGRIRLGETIFGDDFAALRSLTTTAVPKLTIPSPNMVYLRTGRSRIDGGVYPDLDELWADLVAAYRDELARLHALGCTYLQIDDVSLAMVADADLRAELAARGEDADRLHLTFIERLNEVLAGKPAAMTVTVHVCRGNFRSAWATRGSYDFVAEALFGELRADGLFVEYDDERSGGFEPLRFARRDLQVVLGLVTTKRGELESKDGLVRRIEEASRFLPVEQLCLSPQCGFASTEDGNALTADEQRAKLERVVETARDVWG